VLQQGSRSRYGSGWQRPPTETTVPVAAMRAGRPNRLGARPLTLARRGLPQCKIPPGKRLAWRLLAYLVAVERRR